MTIVGKGDTWYGIAFENNTTAAELAAWNGMTEQDTLRLGQRLRLSKPLGFDKMSLPVVENNKTSSPPKSETKVVIIRPSKAGSETIANNVPLKKAPTVATATKPPEKIIIKTPRNSELPLKFDRKNLSWTWPVKGRVVSKFSPKLGRKGIDIAGRQNQEVKVAAPGKVVYQGNGVKGYRNLIIVKHSEDILSAYAHNQQVYVQEGQWVKENQTISTVGLKKGQPLLHFEIRKKGQPVDPLQYLGG